MCQIAGGAVGLGVNTAIVASASSLAEGIGLAFKLDALLAAIGFVVALLFVGGTPHAVHRRHQRFHRAHP